MVACKTWKNISFFFSWKEIPYEFGKNKVLPMLLHLDHWSAISWIFFCHWGMLLLLLFLILQLMIFFSLFFPHTTLKLQQHWLCVNKFPFLFFVFSCYASWIIFIALSICLNLSSCILFLIDRTFTTIGASFLSIEITTLLFSSTCWANLRICT